MPSPIIKIKRGTGKPPVWVPVTNSGLTAGEFAFDANTGVLYVGMLGAGGYTGHFDPQNSSKVGSTVPNVVPIGYQISNDAKFGGAVPTLNENLSYSNYTVPSTYAVRQYVAEAVIAAAAGVDFLSGEGIALTVSGITYTVVNTGVIRGFTSINAIGNAVGDTVRAKSGRDGLTFIGGSGILFTTSNSGGSVQVTNIGVTGIAGFTGNISSITPIVSLSGFTQSINLANRQVITSTTPIGIDTTTNGNSINIFHVNNGVNAGTYNAYNGNAPQLLNIKLNASGHVEEISQEPLGLTLYKPVGFDEAVQDAVYPGITTATVRPTGLSKAFDYGIYFVYADEPNNLLRVHNTGITSIAAANGVGLSGPVRLLGGSNVTLTQDVNTNGITIAYSGTQFNRVASATPGTVGYSSTGIYNGGSVSAGTATASGVDSLNVVAGRGIGISAGTSPDGNSRVLLLYNTGINMISAYDSSGSLLGGTGLSGPINLVAGTNIQLARGSGSSENTITISSTGGGGGGSISDIQADYTTEPGENYIGTWTGSGVTGQIEFIGLNGLVTKQDSGQNLSPSTRDGDLYVGLSSQLVLPSNVFLESPPYPFPLITIPTARATSAPTLPHCGMDNYFVTPIGYSKLITDVVEGGLTAAVTYGGDPGPFSPNTNNLGPFTEPGKLLILRAREGVLDKITGADPNMSGLHAEVRLVAFPNAENMIAYIQEGFDPGSLPNACPGGVCVGFPPTFPSCNADPNNPVWYGYTKNNADHNELTSSVVVHGNLVGKDSLYVNKDIWLTGDLINAKTGCLYQLEGSQGGVNTPGGKLGLTGDLIVNGSIYVHGGTAFFNVNNLSTESPLIVVGGVSASPGYSDPYQSITTSQSGYTADRGLLLHTYSKLPYSPLYNQPASSEIAKLGFVGVDTSEGIFKYVSDASLQTFTTGSNTFTHVSGGRLGPAQFSEINTVGITSDLTTISLKTGTSSIRTDLSFDGFARIVAPSAVGNQGQITLGNNANVIFNDTAAGVVKFARGITFDITTSTGQFGGEANALRIQYNGSNGSRHLTVRNPGTNSHIQLVDTGRSSSSDSGLGSVELAQQIIYNKTFSDGTIIDCGTY